MGSAANMARNRNKEVIPFSKAYKNKRLKLLGHVLRAENRDPMRQVTFYQDSARPIAYTKKRVGKPREHWTETSFKKSMEAVQARSTKGTL